MVGFASKNNHLWLMFRCEGGGGGGSHIETLRSTTSSSCLDAREVVVVAGTLGVACPGGKVSKSIGMGGWKIRTVKTSHNFRFGSFCHNAPFASWFLPSLSFSLLLHFCPCRRAHIPHERGGASLWAAFWWWW